MLPPSVSSSSWQSLSSLFSPTVTKMNNHNETRESTPNNASNTNGGNTLNKNQSETKMSTTNKQKHGDIDDNKNNNNNSKIQQ